MTDEYLLSPESGENELSFGKISSTTAAFSIYRTEKSNKNFEFTSKLPEIRKNLLDHVLLYGPPGLGKTTMAMVIC